MWTIGCNKTGVFRDDSQIVSKRNNASSPVSTHTSGLSIGIIKIHKKVNPFVFSENDEAIGTYAKTSVAHFLNFFFGKCNIFMKGIYHDKIVSRTVVFVKFDGLHLELNLG